MAELPSRVLRDSKPFKRFLLITQKPYISTHRGTWEHLHAEIKAMYPYCLWQGSAGKWHWYVMVRNRQEIIAEGIISHDGTVWHGRIVKAEPEFTEVSDA